MDNTQETYEKLYDIFLYKREKLVDFLFEYGTYDKLNNCIIDIHKKKQDYDNALLYDLLTGKIGYECNKQNAIYELPTRELILFIVILCKILNIEKIKELMAGTGLLSALLNKYIEIGVKAYDSFDWVETSKNLFFDVKKYSLTQCCSPNNNNFLYIISHPDIDIFSNIFKNFIKKQPTYLLIIGEIGKYNMMKQHLKNYKIYHMSTKQICFRDVYINNKIILNHSSILLCSKNNIDNLNDINEIYKKITGETNDLFFKYKHNIYSGLYDMIYRKLIPEWIIEEKKNNDIIEKITYIFKKMYNFNNNFKIPKYVKNVKQLNFWIDKVNCNKLPTNLNEEKFEEYIYLYENIEKNIIDKKIFPSWINNKNDALKYILLDFSLQEKYWKKNKQMMYELYSNITH